MQVAMPYDDFPVPDQRRRGSLLVLDHRAFMWSEERAEKIREQVSVAVDGSFEVLGLAPLCYRARVMHHRRDERSFVDNLLQQDYEAGLRVCAPATGLQLRLETARVEIEVNTGDAAWSSSKLARPHAQLRVQDSQAKAKPPEYRINFHESTYSIEISPFADISGTFEYAGQRVESVFRAPGPGEIATWRVKLKVPN